MFANPYRFPEREGTENSFSGEGEFIPKKPGRHMWETNFVPDLSKFKLRKWSKRGAGGSNMMFVLADGSMHSHMSEMPVGTYKKAHRHGADFHVFCVTGTGYSLFWYEMTKTTSASIGSMGSCSRRPTACITSISTPAPIRRGTSRSPSVACATP